MRKICGAILHEKSNGFSKENAIARRALFDSFTPTGGYFAARQGSQRFRINYNGGRLVENAK